MNNKFLPLLIILFLFSAPAFAQCNIAGGQNYCYSSTSTLEPLQVNICPTAGMMIQLTISGETESCCDALSVYSGANGDSTDPIIFDLGGIFTNEVITGGVDECISIYIDSDGSFTCADQGYTPFNWTTQCIAPPPPPIAAGEICIEATPLCADGTTEFDGTGGTLDVAVAEPDVDLGCLGTGPSPSWFYIEIETPGDLDMELAPVPLGAVDFDYAMWGPFPDVTTALSSCGSALGAPMDCSFASGTGNESPSIGSNSQLDNSPLTPAPSPPAQVGEVYVLLVSKFGAAAASFTLNQVGGGAATNCDIIGESCADEIGVDITAAGDGCATPTCNIAVRPVDDPATTFSELTNNSLGPDQVLPAGDPTGTSGTWEVCADYMHTEVGSTEASIQIGTSVLVSGTGVQTATNDCDGVISALLVYEDSDCATPFATNVTSLTGLTVGSTYTICLSGFARNQDYGPDGVLGGGDDGPLEDGDCLLQGLAFAVNPVSSSVAVCPASNYDFTAPTEVCSGDAIDFTVDLTCAGLAASFDLDLYFYNDGVTTEAPLGYDPFANLSGGAGTLAPGVSDFPFDDANLASSASTFGTGGGCGDLQDAGFNNSTCGPSVVTFFAFVWNRTLNTDGDTNLGEYNSSDNCIVQRFDVTIYPDPLTVVVTDDGTSCGIPTVELQNGLGVACETQSGVATPTGACSANGDALNYDFSATATATAITAPPAGCPLPTLTGTVTCAGCAAACGAEAGTFPGN